MATNPKPIMGRATAQSVLDRMRDLYANLEEMRYTGERAGDSERVDWICHRMVEIRALMDRVAEVLHQLP